MSLLANASGANPPPLPQYSGPAFNPNHVYSSHPGTSVDRVNARNDLVAVRDASANLIGQELIQTVLQDGSGNPSDAVIKADKDKVRQARQGNNLTPEQADKAQKYLDAVFADVHATA